MPQIQSIITRFVTDLTSAIEQQASAAIRSALNGSAVPAKRAAKKRVAVPTMKNGRRSPEAMDAAVSGLLATIRKAPNSSAEQLAATLGVGTKDIVRPLRRLLADKAIGKRGNRRGTRYTAR